MCSNTSLLSSLSPHLTESLRLFIYTFAPKWKDFLIQSHGEYLGIFLGPSAGSMYWLPQTAKYITRVNEIAGAGIAASLAVAAYNPRVASILSYAGQFLPPPPNLMMLEKYAFRKLFKLPHNTVGHAFQFSLAQVGCPVMHSLFVLLTAMKSRFYMAHESLISTLLRDLKDSQDHVLVAESLYGDRPFWDSPSLVVNIVNARSGQEIAKQFSSFDAVTTKAIIDQAINCISGGALGDRARAQGHIYNSIVGQLFRADFIPLLASRCNKYLM